MSRGGCRPSGPRGSHRAEAGAIDLNDPTWLATERAAIERTRRGDRAAFAVLYRALAEPLYQRVLMPRLGRADVAADVLSETFRVALERLDSYEDRGASIYGWLVRIASNAATDALRNCARTTRALANLEALVGPLPVAPEPGENPEAHAAMLRANVANVLAQLNPRYRQAIELRFIAGRERADCAALMDVKIGTFDVLLLRALRSFRETWLATVGAPPEL